MRGTNRIVLLEPQPTGERSRTGQVVQGPPLSHPVRAERIDRPVPGEGLVDGSVLGGDWPRTYVVPVEMFPPDRMPTEDWSVVDEEGVPLRIDGVSLETRQPGMQQATGQRSRVTSRRRKLVLVCSRSDTR